MKNEKMKIFLGCQEIAGMMSRLEQAFAELGYDSDFFCLQEYKFSKAQHKNTNCESYNKYLQYRKKYKLSEKLYARVWYNLFMTHYIIRMYFYVIKNYDAFIYCSGHGMFVYSGILMWFEWIEFAILKLLGKKVVTWFVGSDSRAPYCADDIEEIGANKMYTKVKQTYKRVQMLERYTIVVDNPASSHFHRRPFIIFQIIGIPIDKNEMLEQRGKGNSDKIRIIHAPSDPKSKGTSIIRKVIQNIQNFGYNIEYIELMNVQHGEVIKQLSSSNILIDELFSDTPMAGLGTEAAMNKVVVVEGGYYSEYYKYDLMNAEIPPNIFCNPENVEKVTIELINNKSLRENIAEKQYEFVTSNWSATKVAERFVAVLEGEIKADWLFNPDDGCYMYGLGLKKDKVINNVVKLVDRYGFKALKLQKSMRLYSAYESLYRDYVN